MGEVREGWQGIVNARGEGAAALGRPQGSRLGPPPSGPPGPLGPPVGPWAPLLNARGEGPRDAPTTSRFATGRPHPCPVVGARSTHRCPNNKQIGNIRANFGSKRGPLPSKNAYRTSTISNFVPRFGEKEARFFAGMTIKQALFPTCCPDSVPSRRTIRGTFGTPFGARPASGPTL